MAMRTVHLGLAVFVVWAAFVQAQSGESERTLALARTALGGTERILAVRTLSVAGQCLRPVGGMGGAASGGGAKQTVIGRDFEWLLELPLKYVNRYPATIGQGGIAFYATVGFNADDYVEVLDPMIGSRYSTGVLSKGTPEEVAESRRNAVRGAKIDFARFTLGMFASSFAAFPLEFRYVAPAEAPDGRADVLEVKGPDGFSAQLFIAADSHLPLFLSWQDKEPPKTVHVIQNVVYLPDGTKAQLPPMADDGKEPGLPSRALTPTERERLNTFVADLVRKYDAQRQIVEHRMYYADYREVSGLKLPHRISRAIAGKTVEEWLVEKIKVNSKLDPDTFAPKKQPSR
jgi:hypothetical protein